MKCVVSVLMLLVVSCHHLKTAAQNDTNMTSMSIMPSTTMMNSSESLSISIDMNFSDFSDSFSSFVMMTDESLTINMTEFSPTLDMDMTTTMMTSSFIMTITTDMPMPTPTTMTTPSEVETTSIMPTSTVLTTDVGTVPTDKQDDDDEAISTGVIIGIAAGGGAALIVILVIIICCCCCCYQKHHREESYNIGPTVTARYWDANHPNDVGPGHVTSGGSMRSRTSWRDSLRSFTRGSLRRSFSLRRSSKRAKDKQQPNEYIGLYSTPL